MRAVAQRDADGDPRAGHPRRPGGQGRRRARGRGPADRADQGARRPPGAGDDRGRAGADATPRARPPTCWPAPSARPTSSGWRPSRRSASCAPAPSARPSSPRPPWTARSRRPGGCSPWSASGWPARPPSTTRTALAETKRLVEEAETARRRPPRSGPARRSQQATEARGAAQTEAESILTRARREAEQIIAAATTQAESITSSGDSEKQRQVAALRSEVDRLAKRRDAITAQLASLRDVVAGFGDDEETPELRSRVPADREHSVARGETVRPRPNGRGRRPGRDRGHGRGRRAVVPR